MTGTILAQSNKLPSPQPKAFFLAAAITLLLTLIGCAAEEFADEEKAACNDGHIFSVSSNDPPENIFNKLQLKCREVQDAEKGLTSTITIFTEGSDLSQQAELAVGESFTMENIGRFTLIRAREEPDFVFFRSPSDNVSVCFEPAPDFTYEP